MPTIITLQLTLAEAMALSALAGNGGTVGDDDDMRAAGLLHHARIKAGRRAHEKLDDAIHFKPRAD